jgi:hypothetical protein
VLRASRYLDINRLRRFSREVLSTGFRPLVVKSRESQRYPLGITNPVSVAVDQVLATMPNHEAVPLAMVPNKGWVGRRTHRRKDIDVPGPESKSVA